MERKKLTEDEDEYLKWTVRMDGIFGVIAAVIVLVCGIVKLVSWLSGK